MPAVYPRTMAQGAPLLGVLFVDDEPFVLEGLESMMRKKRREWRMRFVTSGEAALDALSTESFDVIVSDMRMPKMDGATLLKEVQRRHTRIIRIILSGQTDSETSLPTVSVAHRFLSKPCKPTVLQSYIERACNLRASLQAGPIRAIASRIEHLPSLPPVSAAMNEALAERRRSAADIAQILMQDAAMCAKLLRLANSSMLRLSCSVTSIEQALNLLGVATVNHLALFLESFATLPDARRLTLSLSEHQNHAVMVALAARSIAPPHCADSAFMGGLLHDIGSLILATSFSDTYDDVMKDASTSGLLFHEAERQAFGATHAEVGAHLLELWGLPTSVVEAVAHHHHPLAVPHDVLDVLDIVHVAENLVTEFAGSPVNRKIASIDAGYAAGIGIASKLDSYRQTVKEVLQGSGPTP